jgi:hypothetical protein
MSTEQNSEHNPHRLGTPFNYRLLPSMIIAGTGVLVTYSSGPFELLFTTMGPAFLSPTAWDQPWSALINLEGCAFVVAGTTGLIGCSALLRHVGEAPGLRGTPWVRQADRIQVVPPHSVGACNVSVTRPHLGIKAPALRLFRERRPICSAPRVTGLAMCSTHVERVSDQRTALGTRGHQETRGSRRYEGLLIALITPVLGFALLLALMHAFPYSRPNRDFNSEPIQDRKRPLEVAC